MTDRRQLAIDSFVKLITANHTVAGDLAAALGRVYDAGMKVGLMKKALGMDFRKYAKYEPADKSIADAMKTIKSTRVSNKRNLNYDGPDIAKGSEVLVCDFTVKGAIMEMADKDQDYMYFERNRFDKAYHEECLESAQDDPDETEYLKSNYDSLEVKIFMVKCYQVGFNGGEIEGKVIPRPVQRIFDMIADHDDYIAGKSDIFKDEDTRVMMLEYLTKSKAATPEWIDYKSHYNK